MCTSCVCKKHTIFMHVKGDKYIVKCKQWGNKYAKEIK